MVVFTLGPKLMLMTRLFLLTAFALPFGSSPLHGATPMGPQNRLPRVIQIGEGRCPACKETWKILKEANRLLAGQVRVSFINIRWHPGDVKYYCVTKTPTVIFLTADRVEVSRHEGIMTLEEVRTAIADTLAQNEVAKHTKGHARKSSGSP